MLTCVRCSATMAGCRGSRLRCDTTTSVFSDQPRVVVVQQPEQRTSRGVTQDRGRQGGRGGSFLSHGETVPGTAANGAPSRMLNGSRPDAERMAFGCQIVGYTIALVLSAVLRRVPSGREARAVRSGQTAG